jgi:hypothetical protein
MGVGAPQEGKTAVMREADCPVVPIEPRCVEVTVLDGVKEVEVLNETTPEGRRSRIKGVRSDHERVVRLVPLDASKRIQSSRETTEIVEQDVPPLDRGFDARNQDDAPVMGIAGKSRAIRDPIVVRETQDLVASRGSEVN